MRFSNRQLSYNEVERRHARNGAGVLLGEVVDIEGDYYTVLGDTNDHYVRCNGSRLKTVGLAFNAVLGSN